MPTLFCNGLRPVHSGPAGVEGDGPLGLHPHPFFSDIHAEVHARPFPAVDGPVRVLQFVFLRGDDPLAREQETEHLLKLWTSLEEAAFPDSRRELELQLPCEKGGLRLRVQRHTEFSTYGLWLDGANEEPFPESFPGLPDAWLRSIPGRLISAVQLALTPAASGSNPEDVRRFFEGHRLVASKVVEESASVWTSYRLHGSGFLRILVHAHDLHVCRAGRLVQRLLELESYRCLALLGLPLARGIWGRLTELEKDLVSVFDALNSRSDVDLALQQDLLSRLTTLADEVEHLRAETSYRFGATRAYGTLVHELLDQLREEQIPGLLTLRGFLDRRLPAALRTCETSTGRIMSLSERVDRAGQLLRTRIDLTLEKQNQQLLTSMHERSGHQLRLQEAVEGLSVAAIAYYSLGLVTYAAKAGKELGLHIVPEVVAMAALPPVLVALFYFKRRIQVPPSTLHGP